ncbi:MAG: hypothetical protein ACKOFF_03925 [Acidimicrobiales bacterium]
MRRTTAVISALILAVGLVACGGSGTDDTDGSNTTNPSEFIPAYTNKCEEQTGQIIATTLLDNTMDSVYAKWGADTDLVTIFQAMYDELKPSFNAGAVGIGVRYISEYAINVCKDNDVFNKVLELGEGDAGYRSGCLDGKLPDVNESLVACDGADGATTTTTG